MRFDRVQQQRFELKYRVPEHTALAVRDFVQGYLTPDEFAAKSADHSYMVHSLYLDSNELALYRATVNGDKNRFKLRLRYYDDAPNAPVFFEIKRRLDNSIFKQRAAVRREAVAALLEGEWPRLEHLTTPGEKPLMQLQEFMRLMQRMHATPRSHVSYRREAWMSTVDNSARVTFDRDVQCALDTGAKMTVAREDGVCVFDREVIVELKFTSRMPAWATELVRAFGLVQCSAAKYAEGVAAMGETTFSPCGEQFPDMSGVDIVQNWLQPRRIVV